MLGLLWACNITQSLYEQDQDVYGHHQTHFGQAKGQSWEKEADGTFCTACYDNHMHI
jgi:predicted adenine nucleotide alpha hydrolase (AANH) superfamily ATPase